MSWLDVMRAGANANTLNGSSAPYRDPDTGRVYRAVYSTGGFDSQGNADPGTLVNYVSTDGKPWYQGQQGLVHNLNGDVVNSFTVDNYAKREWFDALPAVILAVGTAGAAGLLGPGAAFGAGGSLGTVPAAASLAPGESLVTTGGYSFGVTPSAAELATGVHVSGAEIAAINAGAAFTVPTVMASTSAASAAGSASSLAGAASSLAGTASKAVAALGALLGVGASHSTLQPGQAQPLQQDTYSTGQGKSGNLLYLAAAGLAFFALKG